MWMGDMKLDEGHFYPKMEETVRANTQIQANSWQVWALTLVTGM